MGRRCPGQKEYSFSGLEIPPEFKNVSVRFPYSLNLSSIQVFKKNLQEWTIENLQFDTPTQTKMKISPPKTNA